MPLPIERDTSPLLHVNHVGRDFAGRGWGASAPFRAVDDVSLAVWRGETLGIVGESGSGKSTLGRMIAGLLTPTRGQVLLDGDDVHAGSGARKREVWRRMQMVFQDPYASLNPRMTVRDALLEPMRNFGVAQGQAAEDRARRLLDACGLSSRSLDLFPREFSGGQRQRIGIARALAVQPDLIVADEPVSALDVSVQAQVINLMMDLQAEFRLTYVFIAHDLAVVRQIADRVGVMHKGHMVELADSETLFSSPAHAYTKMLLASSPVADPVRARQQIAGALA